MKKSEALSEFSFRLRQPPVQLVISPLSLLPSTLWDGLGLAVTTVVVAVSMNMFPSVPPKVDVMATGVEPLIMFTTNGAFRCALSL